MEPFRLFGLAPELPIRNPLKTAGEGLMTSANTLKSDEVPLLSIPRGIISISLGVGNGSDVSGGISTLSALMLDRLTGTLQLSIESLSVAALNGTRAILYVFAPRDRFEIA
jgi:hypothetical protein